ncbi:mandelate racemase/muconate lactonizing enzyme family protein [Actinomycetospora sp. OC33-EN08]|uniref:Mandelate racemase/muconate lactonizing enzyme family protein n=1 Tax=Actinomycetospora aurantiaca TaxID=3129233 RepID=A0ABU8MTL2_9PSEU
MKITGIRITEHTLELDPPMQAAWDPDPRREFAATLVAVETDAGIVGVGSGDTMAGFAPHVHHFVGTDPLAIETQVRRIESVAFHGGRYWPLEAALWDVVGQAAGLPVSVLLGGVADRLPVYASWCSVQPPERRAHDARELVAQGFRAVKVRVDPRDPEPGVASVAAVREAVGDRLDVLVDLNQAWRMAGDVRPAVELVGIRRLVRRLAEYEPGWIEEPLPYDDVAGHRLLRAENHGLRIASGEMCDDATQLAALTGELDVVQTDVVLSLGISRTRHLAEALRARHRRFTPHTWSNGLGLLANLHVAAGVGGGPYLEFPHDPAGGWTPERRDFLLAEPLWPAADGTLAVPQAPGLGAVLHPSLGSDR